MGSLYDALNSEDRAKVDKWIERRKDNRYERDIPEEFFLAAELGYYYGWEAVRDFLRNRIDGGRSEKGDYAFTYEDANAFVEAAKKVHYLNEQQAFSTHIRPHRK